MSKVSKVRKEKRNIGKGPAKRKELGRNQKANSLNSFCHHVWQRLNYRVPRASERLCDRILIDHL